MMSATPYTHAWSHEQNITLQDLGAAVICTAAEAVAQHPTSPPSLITNTELFAAAEQELKKRQERSSSAFLSIFQ